VRATELFTRTPDGKIKKLGHAGLRVRAPLNGFGMGDAQTGQWALCSWGINFIALMPAGRLVGAWHAAADAILMRRLGVHVPPTPSTAASRPPTIGPNVVVALTRHDSLVVPPTPADSERASRDSTRPIGGGGPAAGSELRRRIGAMGVVPEEDDEEGGDAESNEGARTPASISERREGGRGEHAGEAGDDAGEGRGSDGASGGDSAVPAEGLRARLQRHRAQRRDGDGPSELRRSASLQIAIPAAPDLGLPSPEADTIAAEGGGGGAGNHTPTSQNAAGFAGDGNETPVSHASTHSADEGALVGSRPPCLLLSLPHRRPLLTDGTSVIASAAGCSTSVAAWRGALPSLLRRSLSVSACHLPSPSVHASIQAHAGTDSPHSPTTTPRTPSSPVAAPEGAPDDPDPDELEAALDEFDEEEEPEPDPPTLAQPATALLMASAAASTAGTTSPLRAPSVADSSRPPSMLARSGRVVSRIGGAGGGGAPGAGLGGGAGDEEEEEGPPEVLADNPLVRRVSQPGLEALVRAQSSSPLPPRCWVARVHRGLDDFLCMWVCRRSLPLAGALKGHNYAPRVPHPQGALYALAVSAVRYRAARVVMGGVCRLGCLLLLAFVRPAPNPRATLRAVCGGGAGAERGNVRWSNR